MNREIKFRVFCKGTMYYFNKGDNLTLSFFSEGIPWGVYDSATEQRYVTGDTNAIFNEPGILMQSTGLKDKNGNDIFEGDVLDFDLSSEMEAENELGVVRFAKGGYWTSQDENHLEEILSEELESFPTEIIGNVFENPELIKL